MFQSPKFSDPPYMCPQTSFSSDKNRFPQQRKLRLESRVRHATTHRRAGRSRWVADESPAVSTSHDKLALSEQRTVDGCDVLERLKETAE